MEPKDSMQEKEANESVEQQTDVEIPGQDNEAQKELERCKAESALWQQRFIQLSADMQNYKRRVEKEQSDWARRAEGAVLLQLLPIVDDFDRALAEEKKQTQPSACMTGFEMISKELYKFLKNMHVTEMQQVLSFDPLLHEAVAQVESADVPSGDIVQVVQKGYMHGDHVLRPAKVTVAR